MRAKPRCIGRFALHDASGQARRAGAADLRRTRSQAGTSAPTVATAAIGGHTESLARASGNGLRRVGPQSKLNRRGKTEAGNAGKQPCQELARWAHRADEVGNVRPPAPRFLPGFKPSYPSSLTSSDDRPLCQYQSEFPAGFQLAIMFTKIIGSWRRHRRAPFYPAAVRGFERRDC